MTRYLVLLAAGASALLLTACENDKPTGPGRPGMAGGGDRKTMFVRIDTNGDGYITRREFMASPRAQQNPQQAPRVFVMMDRNGDGLLSRKEFVEGPN